MRRLIVFAFILFLMSGSLLVAQDVRYNYDRKADFSKFKTYKWVDIKDADHANQLVQKQIRDAVEAELAKKGLQKTDSDWADHYVAYQTALNTEKFIPVGSTRGPLWHESRGKGIAGVLCQKEIL
jgi:hypothetical protein